MRVGSTFTGVGGADMGFEAAGMTISWQCELDAWKRSVLAAHYPNIPIYEDITTLEDPEPVDLMVGGFPCQDLSVAGQRKGFSGERSVLAFEFLRIAETLKPRWLVLENVPGLLSSNKGLDFQRLLREVAACGYGVGYRCLDARYFGVPQRRRRIFIVARRAETSIDPRTASGLALRALCESGSGDTTPCIPPWQDATRTIEDCVRESGGFRSTASFGQWVEDDKAGTLSRRDYKSPNQIISFYSTGGSQNGFWATDGVSNTLKIGSSLDIPSPVAVAYSIREDAKANTFSATEIDAARCLQKQQPSVQSHHAQTFIAETASTLQRNGGERGQRIDAEGAAGGHLPLQDSIVRRLCPTETEALMGWPRNWTAPEGVKASDSRRYAACGDGIVANVAFWIGQRIMQIDEETHGK
jgi:DNA (cytosine-5)-methyltransferase 1